MRAHDGVIDVSDTAAVVSEGDEPAVADAYEGSLFTLSGFGIGAGTNGAQRPYSWPW